MAVFLIPIAALAIRALIQMAVTYGIIVAAEKWIFPALNKGVAEIMQVFGVPEETAKDIMANEIIIFAESVGVGALTLRTKLPTKVAEYLRFTSKGYGKRTLSKPIAEKLGTVSTTGGASAVATAAEVGEIASIVSKSRGLSLATVRSLLNIIATIVGVPTALFFMFAQYIDFANWQGPYQKTFQGLLSKIGINPDSPMPKARVVSTDIWNRIASTVEELGPVGVSFPFSGVDKPYSRQNLADLVDEVAANLAKAGIATSYKNVLAATLPLVQLGGTPGTGTGAGFTLPPQATSNALAGVKVFMGTVKDGVLGAKLDFTPRQDDIIESMGELQQAIDNNLAPFLVTLPGRLIYEVKIVSSIVTSDGLKRTGEKQTVQTGTYSDGRPKTRDFINKWAVLDLYVLTDKKVRSKISSLVLGPTDAVKFRPDNSALSAISNVIPTSAVTLDTSNILSVEQTAQSPVSVEKFAQAIGVPAERINQQTGEIIDPTPAEVAAYNYQFQNIATPPITTPKAQDSATTLFEWFMAQGQKLPSIGSRGQLYQSLGLGQASLYVGTAEQNTRLLNKLKEKPPPPPPVQIAQPAPAPVQQVVAPAPSGFFRPSKGTPVFDRSSGTSIGVADGNTDYNSAIVRT